MNTLYPDATSEELALSDNICIICRFVDVFLWSNLKKVFDFSPLFSLFFREDMVSNSKKLPCGHIFHTLCLR